MLIVRGRKELSGSVKISGSKNACLPIIAASLLIEWKIRLTNVPRIGDVFTFLEILEWIWVEYSFRWDVLEMNTTHLKEADFDLEKIKKIRVSILLLAPLLQRLGKVSIPTPGGCNLWARPIDSHLKWLEDIGYSVHRELDHISLEWTTQPGDTEINAWFGVTATENLIVANVMRAGKTTIYSAAIEPHVMNVIDFLRLAGANIHIRYDHTIIIEGVEELKTSVNCSVVSDYIQSGTYAIIAALASKQYLDIENACIQDLYMFLEKMKEAGVRIEDRWNDTLRVFRAENLQNISFQTNIFPGFPTDLQSPFAVLMSQAEGKNRIHEILFEGRLGWLIELEKMGCECDVINHHEAHIYGKANLKWAEVASWDLRAGAAMVIAWLIAEGETKITNVEYIHRGYDNLVENLQKLWADIEERK